MTDDKYKIYTDRFSPSETDYTPRTNLDYSVLRGELGVLDIDLCPRIILTKEMQIRTDHYVTVDEMASRQQNVCAIAGVNSR